MLVAAAGAALEIPPMLPSVLAGDVVFGAPIPWLVVGLISLAHRVTPPELQGRVYAAVETLITTPQTISIALGAALITVTGYQTLLLALAATIALAAIYLLTRPEQRRAARQFTRTAAKDWAAVSGTDQLQTEPPDNAEHVVGREHMYPGSDD